MHEQIERLSWREKKKRPGEKERMVAKDSDENGQGGHFWPSVPFYVHGNPASRRRGGLVIKNAYSCGEENTINNALRSKAEDWGKDTKLQQQGRQTRAGKRDKQRHERIG